MGLGPAARELYALLDLKPLANICDLGSQEMSLGVEGSARDWLEGQGYKYTCIDLDGKFGAMTLDLNVANATDVGRQFDIVTNHGTGEHVFNQANVFTFMHDITVPGGLMIHVVPTPLFGVMHGYYTYDETIFRDLAFYNSYEIVRMHRRSEPRENILVAFKKISDAAFVIPKVQDVYRNA